MNWCGIEFEFAKAGGLLLPTSKAGDPLYIPDLLGKPVVNVNGTMPVIFSEHIEAMFRRTRTNAVYSDILREWMPIGAKA